MLDTETKRRIDTARDILVGKIPDPKSQIEQITIALIYKFMDDMDKESGELGGESLFFTGNYSKYAWNKILDRSVSGFELVALYGEAIQSMNQNPNLPQLFRDIFKNAYLPYRDPETLRAFLRIIDDFKYDHSERLGDAFEYLLSVMGSQGDAGQFRTPRHIIDFIVQVVDPSKKDTILDPACGTAGFLISAYKHIVEKNMKDGKLDLTPDERKKLVENIVGYDISPDMVRLSLVNLYLHGFKNPHIFEYDTLTSDEKWDEHFDVCLANPPFMTPKGGIRPHKRFSVDSNRAEVLFVDYMAEHLTNDGKAGIVVPEGIIFQSGTTYKQLRKMLVDNALYAVASLPAGVFNPYSGVKTSILFLDKRIAKKTKDVLFVKVETDGYNLGAQRREIKENDLPLALEILQDYQKAVLDGVEPKLEKYERIIAHIVPKAKIGKSGDYNLSGDRYKEAVVYDGKWDLVELGEVAEILDSKRKPIEKSLRVSGIYPYYGATGVVDYVNEYIFDERLVLIGEDGAKWDQGEKTAFIVEGKYWVNNHAHVLRTIKNKLIDTYLVYILNEMDLNPFITGVTVPKLNQEKLRSIKIPLPPLEVQEKIVEEIENYQNIIDGAKKVVNSYKPSFKIDSSWDVVELGKKTEITSSKRIFQNEYVSDGIPFYRTKEVVELNEGKQISLELFISKERYEEIKSKFDVPKKGEILLSAVGTIGISWVISDEREFYFKDGNLLWIKNLQNINPHFLKLYLDYIFSYKLNDLVFGAAYKALTIEKLKELKIPLPPIEIQKKIVSKIEEEQSLVNSNKKLIELFEKKIADKIEEVWGE